MQGMWKINVFVKYFILSVLINTSALFSAESSQKSVVQQLQTIPPEELTIKKKDYSSVFSGKCPRSYIDTAML